MDPEALIRWYRSHGRALPWRVDPRGRLDPWHVLVSEAMLQQTQVATALPYFQRFLERFPDAASLARGQETEVLKLWEGLGYYSRARRLKAAAEVLVERHGGRVPADASAVRALPGVGRYTAGAVLSNAFNLAEPIVDGNVARVLSRQLDLCDPVDGTIGQRRLWAEATSLVQAASSPRDLNQGLMELGALVCTPRSPSCLLCPVAGSCAARAAGTIGSRPVKKLKRKKRAALHRVAVMRRGGRVLLRQRPTPGLWAGLWEFPTLEDQAESLAGRVLLRFSHATTHLDITFVVQEVSVKPAGMQAASWHTLEAAAALPMSNPQRRVLAAVVEQDDPADPPAA